MSGEIDMVPILEALVRHGHDGLVEMEHLWRSEGARSERAGLAWLDRAEAAIRTSTDQGRVT